MKRLIVICILLGLVLTAATAHAQNVDSSCLPVVSKTVSIADAVDIALANNPTISSRKALVTAAGARVGMARAMSRLTFSTTTYATISSTSMVLAGPDTVQPQNLSLVPDKARLNQNFMLMFPLYTGGTIKGRINSARSLENAAISEAASTELDVALTVKTGYNQILLAKKIVEAYTHRVNEATERVRIAESAFKEGRIAKYDLLRNQTELAEAQQQLNNAQKDLDIALIDIKNTMGISQSSQLELCQSAASQEPIPDLQELSNKAVGQRPEVAAMRARVRSAQAVVDVAKGTYKPQVYATAMQDVGTIRDDGFDQGYLVGIAAALPILDGGLRKSSVAEAQAMLQEAKADERDAVLTVNRDVASALTQLNAAAKNVDLANAAVDQANEDYRVIKMRYESGKTVNVEVLDALAALTRAKTNSADALYQYNVARDTLTRAIGQR